MLQPPVSAHALTPPRGEINKWLVRQVYACVCRSDVWFTGFRGLRDTGHSKSRARNKTSGKRSVTQKLSVQREEIVASNRWTGSPASVSVSHRHASHWGQVSVLPWRRPFECIWEVKDQRRAEAAAAATWSICPHELLLSSSHPLLSTWTTETQKRWRSLNEETGSV